ncbi:MAG TPA: hypothetical protein VGV69_04300, partial [Solirubrobacterales bacterium]|nr:hypothetical protein [Solirubrobacterales bacterium]
MAVTLESFEEREAEEREALEAPAAVQEREASRHAYEGLSTVEAKQLLTTHFADVLGSLNRDPSRWLSDATLERPLGKTAADVTSEGDTQLLESSLPVQAENEEGELEKVDLSLEETAAGWEPANPLVEVEIGAEVEEGVEVGDEGVTITQVGAEESAARPLGDKNVFFGEVEEGTDTDLLVSPVSGGVELFDLLRSVDSPETLRFHIDVPQGGELRADGTGGAEVAAGDGMIVGMVPAPHAVDAQGTQVPVSLEVEGSSIVLGVEHREMDLAYPILVDPLYQDWGWWYENKNLQGLPAWGWSESQSGWIHHGYSSTSWPGKGGLFISTQPGSLPSGQWGQWYYAAPNANSYLANAVINPFWRNNRSCYAPNPYPQPYDYEGMWNQTG